MKLSSTLGSLAFIAATLLGSAQARAIEARPLTAAQGPRPESVLLWRQHVRVIRKSVNDLQIAFASYVNGDFAQTGNAIEAANSLTTALQNGTLAVEDKTFALSERDGNYTARLYLDISQSIEGTTNLLKQNTKAISDIGAEDIVLLVLPQLESALDCLGAVLYSKSYTKPFDIRGYVGHYWHKIDNELEQTLKAYKVADYSPDRNPIAKDATRKQIKAYQPLFGKVCKGPNEVVERQQLDLTKVPTGAP